MRRPIIDWNYNDFLTTINGLDFRFIVKSTKDGYEAIAYWPGYNEPDEYYDQSFSRKSCEDAMLRLVDIIENRIVEL